MGWMNKPELSTAGIQAIWDKLTSGLTAVGSIGKLLVDNINATISSRSSHTAADVWSVVTRALTDKAGFTISGTKATLDALNDINAAQVAAEADTALSDYDPPTRAELTTDKDSIITEVNANETKIDAVLEDTGTTIPADLATIKGYVDGVETSLGKVALCITQWGGFEDEILLKAAADPATLATGTKFTPTLPTNATVWKAYLVMKFREIYCAAANYVATAGSVQVEKSAGGSWATGITIAAGTLDVAAGASQSGDCLVGNADVSAQVVSGSEVEFQLVTLRSNADDLALRDVQFGLQIYFTI